MAVEMVSMERFHMPRLQVAAAQGMSTAAMLVVMVVMVVMLVVLE
jgi:hypothetical protein